MLQNKTHLMGYLELVDKESLVPEHLASHLFADGLLGHQLKTGPYTGQCVMEMHKMGRRVVCTVHRDG